MVLSQEKFERLVVKALEGLPHIFRDRLENIEVIVEEAPSLEDLRQARVRSGRALLGLYHGIPLIKRTHHYGNVLPDRIVLFKRNIESICKTEKEVEFQIARVLRHEIAHYFGISDSRLRQMKAY